MRRRSAAESHLPLGRSLGEQDPQGLAADLAAHQVQVGYGDPTVHGQARRIATLLPASALDSIIKRPRSRCGGRVQGVPQLVAPPGQVTLSLDAMPTIPSTRTMRARMITGTLSAAQLP